MRKRDKTIEWERSTPTGEASVLVGVDGSEGGRDALELARVLARTRGACCVVAMPEEDSVWQEAEDKLDGLLVDKEAIDGVSPGRGLVACAERENAGTLVVGSTGRGRIGRALLGSTAEHVLHHAPCEVAVAPRGYASTEHGAPARIAVAVDGSPESKAALTRAEDLARRAGASIEVLVASDPFVTAVEAEFPPDTPSSTSDVLEAAVASVDPALSPTGRNVDPGWRQVVRTIGSALADACGSDVDLLVAGARRPLDRYFLGSVTTHLVRAASCPVLVVHPAG